MRDAFRNAGLCTESTPAALVESWCARRDDASDEEDSLYAVAAAHRIGGASRGVRREPALRAARGRGRRGRAPRPAARGPGARGRRRAGARRGCSRRADAFRAAAAGRVAENAEAVPAGRRGRPLDATRTRARGGAWAVAARRGATSTEAAPADARRRASTGGPADPLRAAAARGPRVRGLKRAALAPAPGVSCDRRVPAARLKCWAPGPGRGDGKCGARLRARGALFETPRGGRSPAGCVCGGSRAAAPGLLRARGLAMMRPPLRAGPPPLAGARASGA